VPQVVWPPGEGRGLLRRSEGHLASLDPCAAVGDSGQLAAPHTGEDAAVVGRAEVRQVVAQQPGQLGMGGHDPSVSLGPVLELPPLPRAAVVSPFAARIRGSAVEVQLAPVLVIQPVLLLLAALVPHLRRQDDVVGAQVDGFLGTEPGVVHDREEGDEPRPAGLLGAYGVEQELESAPIARMGSRPRVGLFLDSKTSCTVPSLQDGERRFDSDQ